MDRNTRESRTLFDIFNDMEGEAGERLQQPASTDAEKVTSKRLFEQLKKQQYRCYYTGKKLTFNNVSLDHKQPLSKGGKHAMSNVVLCLKRVNTMKGQMTEDEFISLCRLVR